ncbi:hypothetical protein [Nocardia yamanashiensis]|uniref:hypothetical protein n=1 Tax=Nocardia yamanashiensis TaxID=209247 RepID=UPI0012FD8BF0|nr:hypothetical protein [Nocardia yamanashiensis]
MADVSGVDREVARLLAVWSPVSAGDVAAMVAGERFSPALPVDSGVRFTVAMPATGARA